MATERSSGQPRPPEPLAELVYVPTGSTKNLPGVALELHRETYESIEITVLAHRDRRIGTITDRTRYYDFSGEDVFMRHGLVQIGTATTTDNKKGFKMMRLFAASIEERTRLIEELKRFSHQPVPA